MEEQFDALRKAALMWLTVAATVRDEQRAALPTRVAVLELHIQRHPLLYASPRGVSAAAVAWRFPRPNHARLYGTFTNNLALAGPRSAHPPVPEALSFTAFDALSGRLPACSDAPLALSPPLDAAALDVLARGLAAALFDVAVEASACFAYRTDIPRQLHAASRGGDSVGGGAQRRSLQQHMLWLAEQRALLETLRAADERLPAKRKRKQLQLPASCLTPNASLASFRRGVAAALARCGDVTAGPVPLPGPAIEVVAPTIPLRRADVINAVALLFPRWDGVEAL